MIVGISENKAGEKFVVIHRDEKGFFRIELPFDDSEQIPFERLEQIRQALDDVIWQKGRYTHIPDKVS